MKVMNFSSFGAHFGKEWEHLPWKVFGSPYRQWQEMPTFLVWEYLIFGLSCISFLHAKSQPGKWHLAVWFMSFITGTANDVFFMALPLVDNFWQAQATVMITPRFPLYISCIYNLFLYYPCVVAWRFQSRLSRVGQSVLAAVLGILLYGPYDILGVKFLWWSWHITDPPIKVRLLEVPVGSTIFVMCLAGTFAIVLHWCYLHRGYPMAVCVLLSALITTPGMMTAMALAQLFAGDPQGVVSLNTLKVVIFFLCGTFLTSCFFRWIRTVRPAPPTTASSASRNLKFNRRSDYLLLFGVVVYYAMTCLIAFFGSPEQHKSTGIHQPFGPCGVEQADYSGQTRHKYVCLDEMEGSFDFHCLNASLDEKIPSSSNITHWYTICGKPHQDWSRWFSVICLLSAAGLVLVSWALLFAANPLKSERKVTSSSKRRKQVKAE